jgi:hypothetical protein
MGETAPNAVFYERLLRGYNGGTRPQRGLLRGYNGEPAPNAVLEKAIDIFILPL